MSVKYILLTSHDLCWVQEEEPQTAYPMSQVSYMGVSDIVFHLLWVSGGGGATKSPQHVLLYGHFT